MPKPGSVDVTREGKVGVLTLNRPPVNALSVGLMEELHRALRDLDAEDSVRVIVVTGWGDRAFCAGGDVSEFAAMDGPTLLNTVRTGQRLLWDLEHSETPTIAAVNGPALGAGSGIAIACDLRVASETASFGHPEAGLGLTLAYAGSVRLARLVGLARAKELIFTGRRVPASEALEIGLVNAVVPTGKALSRALEWAETIAAQSPAAIRAAKKALMEGLEKHYPNSLVAEARYLSQVLEGDEIWEGFRAFLEKRKPRWRT